MSTTLSSPLLHTSMNTATHYNNSLITKYIPPTILLSIPIYLLSPTYTISNNYTYVSIETSNTNNL